MGVRNFSLRTQVLLVLMATAAVSCVAVAWAAERAADDALDTAIADGLTAARGRARRQVADYLNVSENEVRLLGETPTVAQAAAAFATAFDAVPPADDDARAALRKYYAEQFIPTFSAIPAELPATDAGSEGKSEDELTTVAREPAGDPLPENFLPADPEAVRLQASYLPEDGLPVPEGYADAHDRFHAYFQAVKQELGFDDLFLIDPAGGRIMYSVSKGVDFATNLADGPYRGSNLAEVVRRAAASPTRGMVHFTDFAAYGPSAGTPAAFLATPVLDGPHVAGVLAAQLSVDRIDAAMTGGRAWEREGLGRTGQVYLVGPDRLMRSNSRFFLQDEETYLKDLSASGRPQAEIASVRRAGTTILRRRIDNPAVDAALRGETGVVSIPDYRGEPTLTSFAPLDRAGVRYAVIAEKASEEAFGPVRDLRKNLAVLTAGVVCVVTLLSVLAAAWLTKPIRRLTAAAARVGAGATDVRVKVRGRDEFAALGAAFNEMVSGISESRDALLAQSAENERLLCAILPEPVAARMRGGERRIADSFADVTVLFAELSGFARLTRQEDCVASVATLNELVSAFDEAAETLGVEKVKTIGEAYMAVCGLSVARLDHTRRTVEYALEMRRVVDRFNAARDLPPNRRLGLRVGINAGPVTAGVVGTRKFLYDLWGDTVTIADDLRDAAAPDAIRVTRPVHDAVHDLFLFAPDEPVRSAARAPVPTWRLIDEEEEEGAPPNDAGADEPEPAGARR